MAFEYNVPGVDFDKIAKSFADEVYRGAQLNMRREQILQNELESFYRRYTGGVRKEDLALANEYFNKFSSEAKKYQRMRKTFTNSDSISSQSKIVQEAKNEMDNLLRDSTLAASIYDKLGKIPKTQIEDYDGYEGTVRDFTMNVNQLKEKYGGDLGNINTSFPLKTKFNAPSLAKQISLYAQGTGAKMFSKGDIIIDVATGKPKTQKFTEVVGGKEVQFDVPVRSVSLGYNPESIRSASFVVGSSDSNIKSGLNQFRNMIFMAAENTSDQKSSSYANDLIGKTMRAYGITKPEEIQGYQLFAEDMISKIPKFEKEVPDFKMYNEIKSSALKTAKVKDYDTSKDGKKLSEYVKFTSWFSNLINSGLINEGHILSYVNESGKSLFGDSFSVDSDMINKILSQKVSMAQGASGL